MEEDGVQLSKFEHKIDIKKNSVNTLSADITIFNEDKVRMVRPYDVVRLSAGFLFKNPTEADKAKVSWMHKRPDTKAAETIKDGSGKVIHADAIKMPLLELGEHIIEVSTGSFDLKGNDSTRIIVAKNAIKDITIHDKVKLGKNGHFSAVTLFGSPLPKEIVEWSIRQGSDEPLFKSTGSECTGYVFNEKGKYTVSCVLKGSDKAFEKVVEVLEVEVTKANWTDEDGNKLVKSGFNQEVNAHFESIGLKGEKVRIDVYDQSFWGDEVIHSFTTGTLTSDSNRLPINLSGSIKSKIEEGSSKIGKLYFKISPVDKLKIRNHQNALAEYLDVSATKEIYEAYFSDASDDKKFKHTDYEIPLYLQIYARNIDSVQVTILESDNIFGKWGVLSRATIDDMDWIISKKVLIEEKCVDINRKTGQANIPIDLKKYQKTAPNKRNVFAYISYKEKDQVISRWVSEGLLVFKASQDLGTVTEGLTYVKVERSFENRTSICECQKYNLIWGNVVSCEFRKKVVTISKLLELPQENYEGANWLMSVMALETGGKFDPTIGTFKKNPDDNREGGYVGLVQIGSAAAKDLAVKRSLLIKMTQEQQLDYVLKYYQLPQFKGKLKSRTDLYLAVNYQSACGKGSDKNYVVYDSSKDAYDDNPSFKKEDDEFYFDKKGIKRFYTGRSGKSYVWEFDKEIGSWATQGLAYKTSKFCVNSKEIQRDVCPMCKKSHLDLRESIKWQTQFDSKWGSKSDQDVACWKTCQDILINSGLSKNSGLKEDKFQVAEENAKRDAIVIYSSISKNAIIYMDSELDKGNPLILGVDHDFNYKGGNLNEGTTDHFVVAVGRGCEEGKIYYFFYDVGTTSKEKGTNDSNKLYLNENDYSLIGTTNYNGKKYTVSQIRLNK